LSSSSSSSSCVGSERAHPVQESARVEDLCNALLHICRGDETIESRERLRRRDERERSHLPLAAACAGVSIFKEYICAAHGARRHTCPSILLPAQTPQLAPICPAATAPLAPCSRYSISNDIKKKNRTNKKQIYIGRLFSSH